MIPPPEKQVRATDTHRFIAFHRKSALKLLVEDEATLLDIIDLERATDPRLHAENELLPAIGSSELVFVTPNYAVVNRAFCHSHPLGGRFHGPSRGIWRASFTQDTALRELIWHRTVQLAEIGVLTDSILVENYLADFDASFHDIRDSEHFAECMVADNYVASQVLGRQLFHAGSNGVIYHSVRKPGGTCISCFRSPLVGNVRAGGVWRVTWENSPVPIVVREIIDE
jgi:hypothetical protein